MKYLGLVSLFLLAGCQSTPTFCESEPGSTLCDVEIYHEDTKQALQEFDAMKSNKAFALAQTEDGWELFGYSEGYKSTKKAQKRALMECNRIVVRHGVDAKCEIIR